MDSVHNDVSSSIYMTSLVQFFLVLLLFIALIFSIHELVFFSVTLIATALFSYIWSFFSFYRITLKVRAETRSVFCGELLKVYLDVENRKILPVLIRTGLFMENLVVKGGGVRKTAEEDILFWFQEKSFSFEFVPRKRGVYFIHSPYIRSGDLAGFSFRRQSGKGGGVITVYPRIHNIINFKIEKRDYSGTGKGINYIPERLLVNGIREYENGSSIRDIHWQSTAKFNMLMEKVFDSAKKEKVLVILDVNNFSNDKESFESSIEAAASALVKLHHEGIPAGFLTNGNIYNGRMRYLPVSGNISQLMLILETLSGIRQEAGVGMKELIKNGNYLSSGLSCLYFASSLSEQLRDVRFFISKRGIPSLYVLSEDYSTSGADIIHLDDFLLKKEVLE